MANEEILKEEEVLNEEEMMEYDTFTYEMNGKVMEWAITDEFEFEDKTYIVCTEVIGDELSDEGLYLFEGISEGVVIVLIRRKGGKKNAKKAEEDQETKPE